MKIGEFSEKSGFSISKIRFLEREGILIPERNRTNQYRNYNQNHLREAKIILNFQRLQFPLSDIRDIIRELDRDTFNRTRVRKKISEQLTKLCERRKEINTLIQQMEEALSLCDESGNVCRCKVIDKFSIESPKTNSSEQKNK